MFKGEFEHSLDEKNRLTMPSKFRERLGDHFTITRGLDSCLFVYPDDEWAKLEEKLKGLPFTRADARAFSRMFFSGAADAEPDKQGRVIIPANLKEHAKIERDVVIVGVATRVEVWAKAEWESFRRKAGESYEEIAEKIVDIGI
ncbi:MAG TPA: division/cell wall cluster transcriptional repressor MraZ [Bacillota bacterium]